MQMTVLPSLLMPSAVAPGCRYVGQPHTQPTGNGPTSAGPRQRTHSGHTIGARMYSAGHVGTIPRSRTSTANTALLLTPGRQDCIGWLQGHARAGLCACLSTLCMRRPAHPDAATPSCCRPPLADYGIESTNMATAYLPSICLPGTALVDGLDAPSNRAPHMFHAYDHLTRLYPAPSQRGSIITPFQRLLEGCGVDQGSQRVIWGLLPHPYLPPAATASMVKGHFRENQQNEARPSGTGVTYGYLPNTKHRVCVCVC